MLYNTDYNNRKRNYHKENNDKIRKNNPLIICKHKKNATNNIVAFFYKINDYFVIT